ncbi:MAG: hypothetical protein MI799_01900 [Desulfobacterales bacterium]|nr:hypothetical protein [Desulfobacterales bacterium]
MTISENLKLKLNANQCEIYITGADDLLAAWRHQKEKSSGPRCFDFFKSPMAYKLSASTGETKAELMPCHISIWSHSSHLKTILKPDPEYSVMSCHGHGRAVKLTTDDIGALDATSFTRRNLAP